MAQSPRAVPVSQRLSSLLVGMETGLHSLRREQRSGNYFSKVLSLTTLHTKYTREMTFEILCQLCEEWSSIWRRTLLSTATSQSEHATCRLMYAAPSPLPPALTARSATRAALILVFIIMLVLLLTCYIRHVTASLDNIHIYTHIQLHVHVHIHTQTHTHTHTHTLNSCLQRHMETTQYVFFLLLLARLWRF
jgi:hypothetical protein